MADIYTFPTGVPANGRSGVSAARRDPMDRPAGVPDTVWFAVESVRRMERIPGVQYREIPVPSTLADFGIGVEIEYGRYDDDVTPFSFDADTSSQVASGWIMVLYSSVERQDWGSNWRCVAFARMPLDGGEDDCLTPSMYWEDMCAHLDVLAPVNVGGTVTVTRNTSFGTLEEQSHAGCEIRASWTPQGSPDGMDAGDQVEAWSRFVRSTVRFADEEEAEG